MRKKVMFFLLMHCIAISSVTGKYSLFCTKRSLQVIGKKVCRLVQRPRTHLLCASALALRLGFDALYASQGKLYADLIVGVSSMCVAKCSQVLQHRLIRSQRPTFQPYLQPLPRNVIVSDESAAGG